MKALKCMSMIMNMSTPNEAHKVIRSFNISSILNCASIGYSFLKIWREFVVRPIFTIEKYILPILSLFL